MVTIKPIRRALFAAVGMIHLPDLLIEIDAVTRFPWAAIGLYFPAYSRCYGGWRRSRGTGCSPHSRSGLYPAKLRRQLARNHPGKGSFISSPAPAGKSPRIRYIMSRSDDGQSFSVDLIETRRAY
jgi:hypothetical protein